jgi:hypothetical protein
MRNGFVLIHKKILENPVFVKAELLQLFIYCIIKANYKDNNGFIFNGKIESVKRGSFITGQIQLSKELKQSQSSVYRRLKLLEQLGYISLKVNNRFTLVTVLKYETYQDVNFKMNNSRITSEYNKQYIKKEKRITKHKNKFPMDTKDKEKNYLNSVVSLLMILTKKEKSNCFALVNKLLKYKAEDSLSKLQKCLMLMFVLKANQERTNESKYIGILTNQYRELSYSDFKTNIQKNKEYVLKTNTMQVWN